MKNARRSNDPRASKNVRGTAYATRSTLARPGDMSRSRGRDVFRLHRAALIERGASGRYVALMPAPMQAGKDPEFPRGTLDERELYLRWLGYLRGAVLRKLDGLSDEQARWTPEGRLISLLGIVNHLTHVEWRWIDGGMRGEQVDRSEAEFSPGPELTVAAALEAYRSRADATDAFVRSETSLSQPCRMGEDADLRWVLLHLVNETARHAGHADATRELLDGTTGE
jgi:uncharacterized damage-inducible protein DinB